MRNLYTRIIFLLLITNSLTSHGQQDPMFSQYMFNGLAINPAYAGSSELFSATALYRKQWVGIKGAAETQTFAFDFPVLNKKIGLGLNIANDKIGVVQNSTINAMYAYRIKFEKGIFAMGIQAGINNYVGDYVSVVTSRSSSMDESFSDNFSRLLFNWGGGLYYYNDKLTVGFAVPHIINNKLTKGGPNVDIDSRQYRHYFFTAGYVFTLSDKLKTKPSTLVKFVDGAPLQVDITNNFWYKEKFGFGLSYRTFDSFSVLLQFQASNRFRFGYAYDYILTGLNRFNTGTHELMLRYEIRPKNTKIITPRFF